MKRSSSASRLPVHLEEEEGGQAGSNGQGGASRRSKAAASPRGSLDRGADDSSSSRSSSSSGSEDEEEEDGGKAGGGGSSSYGRRGISPRNNAFTRGRSDSRASEASSVGTAASLDSETTTPVTSTSSLSTSGADATTSSPKAAASSGTRPRSRSLGSEGGGESPVSSEAEPVEEEEADEEEWDPFDIDPELLDNTLYNAGCLDVHDSHADYLAHENELGFEMTGDEDDIHLSAPNVVMREAQAWKALRSATSGRVSPSAAEDSFTPSRPRVTHPGVVGAGAASDGAAAAGEGSHTSAHGKAKKVSGGGRSGTNDSVEPSPDHALVASRPVFERNRCTITLVHGQYEKAVEARKRPKRYVVASDGSEEAAYATEWTIGTVLRDGDEALIVSVMETDSKLDSKDSRFDSKRTRTEHQMIRQNQALILARQATALLQRTRLGVRVSCQALHAKNARHMLLDLIDFFEPTLVVVGSRGLGSLKGILLGSTSHYLVQKSSCPVSRSTPRR